MTRTNIEYIKHRCPRCNSPDITPIGKRQLDRENDICEYICEDCNHQWGPVIYTRRLG